MKNVSVKSASSLSSHKSHKTTKGNEKKAVNHMVNRTSTALTTKPSKGAKQWNVTEGCGREQKGQTHGWVTRKSHQHTSGAQGRADVHSQVPGYTSSNGASLGAV